MKFYQLASLFIVVIEILGVLLAINHQYPSLQLSTPLNLELLLVQIGVTSPIRICLLYNPPNANHDYTNNLLTFLRTLIADSTPLIIMGDFNMPDINWLTLSGHSGFSNQLCDLIFEFNLSQLVD